VAVFKREFLAYFNSPVLYVIVVIFLLAAMGFPFFFSRILDSEDVSLTERFFVWHPWIYTVLAPAVGMRLWSEEHRLGTIELLMTMPVSPWQAILGKFFAASCRVAIGLGADLPHRDGRSATSAILTWARSSAATSPATCMRWPASR
jgi:ABC-2 type transport system permease protein